MQKGTNLIDIWMGEQTEEGRNEFLQFCRRHFHKKAHIQKYLEERGLEIKSLATIYKWVASNISAGDQAILFNAECQDYIGVEIVPAMEKILAQLVRISQRYIEVIEAASVDQIPLAEAMSNLPNYAREVRTIADQIERTTRYREIYTLALDGAARVYEIVMNSPGVRDSSEEQFIRATLEAAIAQLQEEIEKTPVK